MAVQATAEISCTYVPWNVSSAVVDDGSDTNDADDDDDLDAETQEIHATPNALHTGGGGDLDESADYMTRHLRSAEDMGQDQRRK